MWLTDFPVVDREAGRGAAQQPGPERRRPRAFGAASRHRCGASYSGRGASPPAARRARIAHVYVTLFLNYCLELWRQCDVTTVVNARATHKWVEALNEKTWMNESLNNRLYLLII